jgi:hypothetical protein
MMRAPKSNIVRLVSVFFAAMLIFASVAAAAVSTDEYKEKVEPICKTNKEASDKYLKGVRQLVKNDKLKQASERFTKAANALEKAQKQLALVEQPAESTTKLTKWLKGVKEEVGLMRTIAAKFKAGNKGKASSLVVKLTHNANTTNNLVLSFGFNYCKIDPSKYT